VKRIRHMAPRTAKPVGGMLMLAGVLDRSPVVDPDAHGPLIDLR
jgi:hypothetical protein